MVSQDPIQCVLKILTDMEFQSTEDLHTMYNDGFFIAPSGPGLSAPGRDRLGWLPMDRIYIEPCCNTFKTHVRLTSLSIDPRLTTGYLMARVPITTTQGEPFAYYTVEFRTTVGFDRGLVNLGEGRGGVVIHRVNETEQANWLLYPRFPEGGKNFAWCE
jgi:hypothetical protein